MKLKSFFATLCCVSLLVAFSSCKSSDKWENVDLIPVQLAKNGNWSMLDKDGNILYRDEFKNAPTVAYNGYFSVEENDGYTLYKIGKKKPEPVNGCDRLKSVGYMEEGLIPVTFPNERISIVDEDGNKKFTLNPIKNSEVIACEPAFSEGLLVIELENGKMGCVDKSGNLAFPIRYDFVSSFSDGLAVAATALKNENDETESLTYSVINKKGDEVFKLKEDYHPLTNGFIHGKLLVRCGETYYFFNDKGEKTKLPLQGKTITDINANDDYLIFLTTEKKCGALNYDGEVIIRPKYTYLDFGSDGEFIGRREGNDNETIIIDKDDEIKKITDYDWLIFTKGFGYMAKSESSVTLLDDDFKLKCKEDFFSYNLMKSPRPSVESDYFDINSLAKSMVEMIKPNGVGDYLFGTSASQILTDKNPKDYINSDSYELNKLNKNSYRYIISAIAGFTTEMGEYDSYPDFYWNPKSNLSCIRLSVFSLPQRSEWVEKCFKAFKSSLSEAGYKNIKSGVSLDENYYVALYQKNQILVFTWAFAEGSNYGIIVASDKEAPYFESYAKSMINSYGEISKNPQETKLRTPDYHGQHHVAAAAPVTATKGNMEEASK